ncbi:MAG: hypothetical protein Q8R48_04905, partial [Candidatus Omnitrophota bacterium]|nr:hypothetical protein [Candidatus Omnitrophota bacterium]
TKHQSDTYYVGEKGNEIADYSFDYYADGVTIKQKNVYQYERQDIALSTWGLPSGEASIYNNTYRVADDGTLYAVFTNNFGWKTLYARKNNQWSQILRVYGPADDIYKPVVSQDGAYFMTFTVPGIYTLKKYNSATSATQDIFTTTSSNDYIYSPVVSSDGAYFVTYNYTGTTYAYHLKRYSNVTNSVQEIFGTTNANDSIDSIPVVSGDTAYFKYAAYVSGTYYYYLKTYNSGTNSIQDVMATTVAGDAIYRPVATDDGAYFVVRNYTGGIYYYRLKKHTSATNYTQEIFGTTNANDYIYTTPAVSGSDIYFIVRNYVSSAYYYHLKKYNSATSATQEIFGTSTSSDNISNLIVSGSNAYFIYYNGTNYNYDIRKYNSINGIMSTLDQTDSTMAESFSNLMKV